MQRGVLMKNSISTLLFAVLCLTGCGNNSSSDTGWLDPAAFAISCTSELDAPKTDVEIWGASSADTKCPDEDINESVWLFLGSTSVGHGSGENTCPGGLLAQDDQVVEELQEGIVYMFLVTGSDDVEYRICCPSPSGVGGVVVPTTGAAYCATVSGESPCSG